MRKTDLTCRDYSSFSLHYQCKLPLNLEISIPNDDPVRLLSAFVEEIDLSDLYKIYDRIRKSQASPRQMLKIVLYAAMNRLYSNRGIESACIKGNHCKTPMSERNKVIQVSKPLIAYRKADMERIESDYGSMLRMNRSIQAEGSFADVK